MIPHTQDIPIDDPRTGDVGDCQRAAIASVLGIPMSYVPHFAKECRDVDAFVKSTIKFLAGYGFFLIEFNYLPMSKDLASHHEKFGTDCYHLIVGKIHSEQHVVVGLNGQIVHDTNPMSDGFENDPSEWRILLFGALDPSRWNSTQSPAQENTEQTSYRRKQGFTPIRVQK